ncbi:MAG: hypothetical protein JKY65_27755 [Planctomycetes bacterium]|nr:hypothetical protein [Planctomycetota bacterium]
MKRALEGLTSYVYRERRDWLQPAVDAFFDDPTELGEWEVDHFAAYLTLGYTDPKGKRAIDLYLEQERQRLRGDERSALEVLQEKAFASLFEVLEVRGGEGLGVEDVANGEEFFVHESLATRQLLAGDHLLAWVVPLGERKEFTSVLVVPPEHVPLVCALVGEAVAAAEGEVALSLQESLRRAIPRVQRRLRRAIRAWIPPMVLNPKGEEFEVCCADYEVPDPEAVRARLREHPDVLERDDYFVWTVERLGGALAPLEDDLCGALERSESDLGPPEGEAFEFDGREPGGMIELKTVRLTLTTDSRPALERAKRFIEQALGSSVRHRADRITAQEELSREASELPGPSADLDPWLSSLPDPSFAEDSAKARPERADRTPDEQGRHRLPILAHEQLKVLLPGLERAVGAAARELREGPGWEHETLLADDMLEVPLLEELITELADSIRDTPYSEDWKRSEMSVQLSHLHYFVNYELHRRKTFWVDESLAWMLSQTRLDIQGACLRLPFPTLALVFTDPWTLDLAESLTDLQNENPTIKAARLEVLTAYVVQQEQSAEGTHLSFYFVLGTGELEEWPYMVNRELFVRVDDDLEAVLESRPAELLEREQDPFFQAPELKRLLHLAINAILYATSAHLDPIVLAPPPRKGRRKGRRASIPDERGLQHPHSREEVVHLAGKVAVGRVRQLSELEARDEGARLFSRFMVRGHWRRAAKDWKDQRLRWIEPYWKGPDLASIVEREYRLRP